MAKPNVLLLQALLKNKNNIRDGVFKIQDLVTDYFKMGGKNLEVNDRAIIEEFFVKEAPSNVTSMDMANDLVKVDQNPQTPYSMANDLGKRNPGLNFTDDMTFGQVDEMKQGLGALPKGVPGEVFDTKNAARDEMAGFINKMRGQGMSNPDIAGVRRVPGDEQKRTAELVVNQNRMGADTSIKQEFMEEFTELQNTKGPRFFKDESMGYDSVGDMINNKGIEARNAIVDDLELLGVAENELMQIARSANEVAANNPFAPEAWITSMKQDLELSNINYDMRFWDNYFDQLIDSTRKDPPMFRHGGLV
tara:strand:+ start:19 stop:936 length:918 start_codon:yes stop_codon:yes gene_type:complete